jgi:uroporphyrinogen decarboxylase
MPLTHRERVLAAINHQQPDRVPVDLGGAFFSTMTAAAHERLRAYLGLPAGAPTPVARRSSTVFPDEAILRRLDIDVRPVALGNPDGRPDRVVSEDAFVDEWSVTWTKAPGGHYLYTDGPFYHVEEPTLQDLEKIVWPDPADAGRYRGLRERARQLAETTDYAIVLNIAPGPIHLSQFMRGYGAWLEDILLHQVFFEGLIDRITEIQAEIIDRVLAETSEYIDMVAYGDDLGMQKGPLIRPALYRQLIKPRHKRLAEAVKKYHKPILYHSCGSVYAFIPDLIDLGIEILNPIQVGATEMDTKRLKREFGRDLCFWGGIDVQQVLPFGTPQQVREEVKHRIDDLGNGGGYVVSPSHNLQPEVPPQNVVAMYEAALEYGS